MCFQFVLTTSIDELEDRFQARFNEPHLYQPSTYNGFQFPATPIILHTAPQSIRFARWGLIPPWAQDERIRNHTLNARIETIHEKPAYRTSVNNRCLVLADGFFEWQWLDPRGKRKQKYLLSLPLREPFALAGLWSEWVNKATGELLTTYTILTTEANELLSTIHNSKKRMPLVLAPAPGKAWLKGGELALENDRLVATPNNTL